MAIISFMKNNNCWQGCGEVWHPHTLVVGMYNGAATVKNSMMVSQKDKHRTAIGFSNSTSRYVPQRTENKYSNRYLNMYVYSNGLQQANKVVCPGDGILFSHKNEWSTDTWSYMDEPQKKYVKWKKSGKKRSHILHTTSFIWNIKNGKSIETKSRLVVTRNWGWGGMGSDCSKHVRFPSRMMRMFWN